jgi:hypothetical protein
LAIANQQQQKINQKENRKQIEKGTEERKKKEKYEGFPRTGGDFVAPSKKKRKKKNGK